ncbi:hypothetical protein PR08_gp21 [Idiomarinaceae phage Phi1M2-2]|uniref:hypothetical protein n=1 Tax=Idiomarinaceae phage Phi1M2-2 TaxID=1527515 RepID=UPI0004F70ED7|nr:hypothetical protein PR08_gp21 [Idiomarinaceae phage Phi1M2-2]AIM40778.1 hypothetical protein M22_021 [Idiomarinaceae phage Phi1M2-2]
MNSEKREVIEQAVLVHDGLWPHQYQKVSMPFLGKNVEYDDFTQVAREMGFINGYRYGVEYPTNGKRPDLPDDVVVVVGLGDKADGYEHPCQVWHWEDGITSFCIVDERYKPKEGGRLNGKYNSASLDEREDVPTVRAGNWHERGELPPVGEAVEV